MKTLIPAGLGIIRADYLSNFWQEWLAKLRTLGEKKKKKTEMGEFFRIKKNNYHPLNKRQKLLKNKFKAFLFLFKVFVAHFFCSRKSYRLTVNLNMTKICEVEMGRFLYSLLSLEIMISNLVDMPLEIYHAYI